MRARQLMTSTPAVVTADDSIQKAAEMMRTVDVGMLPVVDDMQHRRLIGVITDRDIVVRCVADRGAGPCQVRHHMTMTPLVFVDDDATAEEIGAQMEQFQVRRIPVVGADMRVIGIVTQADLARLIGPHNPQFIEEVVERISTPGALTH